MVLDMATPPLGMVMDMVLDLLMPSQRQMLFMELMDMVDMALDTVHTLLGMVLDTEGTQPLVVGLDMAVGLDIMVKLFTIQKECYVIHLMNFEIKVTSLLTSTEFI